MEPCLNSSSAGGEGEEEGEGEEWEGGNTVSLAGPWRKLKSTIEDSIRSLKEEGSDSSEQQLQAEKNHVAEVALLAMHKDSDSLGSRSEKAAEV